MFVLNLSVSFGIASYVALRAYDVNHKERMALLSYVLKQIVQSPLQFLFPVEAKLPAAGKAADAVEPPASVQTEAVRADQP